VVVGKFNQLYLRPHPHFCLKTLAKSPALQFSLKYQSLSLPFSGGLGIIDKQTIAIPKIANGFELLGETPPIMIIKKQIAIVTRRIPFSTSLNLLLNLQ